MVECAHSADRTKDVSSSPTATRNLNDSHDTASKKDKTQRIQMAKDSANNPKVERLEKIRRFYLKLLYILSQGQDQLRGLALTSGIH